MFPKVQLSRIWYCIGRVGFSNKIYGYVILGIKYFANYEYHIFECNDTFGNIEFRLKIFVLLSVCTLFYGVNIHIFFAFLKLKLIL